MKRRRHPYSLPRRVAHRLRLAVWLAYKALRGQTVEIAVSNIHGDHYFTGATHE